jgi:hypothetical protein
VRAHYRAIDFPFTIETDIPGAFEVVDRLFAPFRDAGSNEGRRTYRLGTSRSEPDLFELLVDGRSMQRPPSPGSMLEWVISNVTTEAVTRATDLVCVHASAAALDGRAIVLPARSGHGKSTTVAGLVRAGWDLLTDEAALFDPCDGLVHPFPRPIALSAASMSLFPGLAESLPASYELFRRPDHHVMADDLRPGGLGSPARVAFVVLPSYAPGVTELIPLARSEALLEILRGTFNLEHVGGNEVETLGRIVGSADCYRLHIGSLDAAVNLIRGLFAEGQEDRSQANAGIGAMVPSDSTW